APGADRADPLRGGARPPPLDREQRGGRPRGAAPGRGAPGAHRRRARGVITVVSFVVVIGLLILIHELGHFLVARWVGVGVERFSIGFGPVLLRWRGREPDYCLSAIPM